MHYEFHDGEMDTGVSSLFGKGETHFRMTVTVR